MQVVSSRWEPAIRAGSGYARPVFKAEVYNSSSVLLASTDVAVAPYPKLDLISGEVTVDATAAILRRCTLTFAIDEFSLIVPDSGTGLLSNTSGNEIKVYRGLEYTDGTTEWMQQGVFGFAEDETADTTESGQVSLTLYDRSRRISRSKFTKSYTVAKGTNYADAIILLLISRMNGLQYSYASTTFTTPFLVFDPQDDPWAQAQEMAKSIGYELFFDVTGTAVLRPRATPVTVDFNYVEGEDATFMNLVRRSNNEGTYNGVVMTGASSSNVSPPRAEAWDVDPASPTYSGYDSTTGTFVPTPYGQVPYFESNDKLTTNGQCSAAAIAKLDELKGRTEAIEFDAFVNAAHEHRDLIYVKRGRSKIDANYELEAFNIPLNLEGVMRARTKERRVFSG